MFNIKFPVKFPSVGDVVYGYSSGNDIRGETQFCPSTQANFVFTQEAARDEAYRKLEDEAETYSRSIEEVEAEYGKPIIWKMIRVQ